MSRVQTPEALEATGEGLGVILGAAGSRGAFFFSFLCFPHGVCFE